MTRKRFLACLRAFLRRRPFQPFAIELASGDRVHIRHPEAVRVVGEVVLFHSPKSKFRLFEVSGVSQLLDDWESQQPG